MTSMRGLKAAVWGLSFKPCTDDVREAPSLKLIERMSVAGLSVSVYDPIAMNGARTILAGCRGIRWCDSAAAALEDADVLVMATEWEVFLTFPPLEVARALNLRTVYDGRNALDATAWRAAGLRVVQYGRPSAESVKPSLVASGNNSPVLAVVS